MIESEINMSESNIENSVTASEKPVIEFKGVSKRYANGTHALEDVNITINKGEFVFVVGSSGAGKSTFMKLIMREERANTGIIRVNGFNLTKMKRKQVPMLRRTMGIIFQDFRLIPKMSVYDNVAFAMHVVGAPNRRIRKEVINALNAVGLGDKKNSMPNELSGGEQQRVGIARALVNNPDLIIADEPTGNVDPNMSFDIVSMLKSINEMGTTVLMVTHDHELVREFKQRVIMLDSGRIIADNVAGGDEE